MERRMLDYYPCVIRDYVEFKGIADGQQWLFDGLWNEADRAFANQYVATADEYGLGRWEKMLHIVPKDTDTIEFRRARILNRINQRPPFTIRYLRQQLDSLIGAGKYEVYVVGYSLYIEAAAEDIGYSQELDILLDNTLPANIVYVSRPTLTEGILLSEGVGYATREFNYLLGSWQLGRKPFFEETEMGDLKLPEDKSIQAALITDSLENIRDTVASARVNGAEVVGSLKKTIEDGYVLVSYVVNVVEPVRQVELLGAGGEVLTSSKIYIGRTGTAEIRHKIYAKEGV